jgi:hypothetical protein
VMPPQVMPPLKIPPLKGMTRVLPPHGPPPLADTRTLFAVAASADPLRHTPHLQTSFSLDTSLFDAYR